MEVCDALILETFVVGAFGANCYIVGCEETKEAAIIDPGGDAGRILAYVRQRGLQVKSIINTHGHVDHMAANGPVKEGTAAPILIHRDDAPMLTSGARNLSLLAGVNVRSPEADRELEDGDVLTVGKLTLKVIHTPGHTPGGISLLCGDMVFTGDTLFAGSIGRSDFPGGSHETLIHSIKEKLLPLPDETVVLPGHGPRSTIGQEKDMNPFLV